MLQQVGGLAQQRLVILRDRRQRSLHAFLAHLLRNAAEPTLQQLRGVTTRWTFACARGHQFIQLRKEGTGEVLNYEVSGDKIQSVIMLPGYTHNIINLSDTEDLVTVMYCNEIFDPNKPDTYFDKVEQK